MKIILASKSGVRKQILDNHNIDNEVIVSNVDEEEVKDEGELPASSQRGEATWGAQSGAR
mgnify:CR=1 FL=1